MLDLIAVFSLLGATFALFKMMLKQVNHPLFIVGLSGLVSGLGYLLYGMRFSDKKLLFSRDHIRTYIGLIFITFLLPQALRFWSLKHLSSVKLGLITNLAPFFTAALGCLLRVEKLNHRKVLALCIGFVGMIPTLLSQNSAVGDTDVLLFFSWPEIMAVLSVLSFSYGLFIRRRAMVTLKISSIQVNMIGLTGMGLVMIPLSLIYGGPVYIKNMPVFLSWFALFIVTMHLFGYMMLNKMIKKYHPTMIALAGFIRPLTIVIIGWFFLGESISWHFFLSMALVLCGLILYYKEDLVSS